MVKMYKCSNLFGIVGSKNNKDFMQKELIIWDDKNNKDIYKFKFKKDILNLELTEDSIVVVCEKSIYVFNIEDFQLVDVIRTGPNPKGLVAINRDKRKVIVYPSVEGSKGMLTIKNYELNNYLFLNPMEKKEFEYFTLSWGGILLATLEKESEKIRIYETQEGGCLSDLLEISAKIPKCNISIISIIFLVKHIFILDKG
jgi:WD40 repeat protein